MGTSACEARFPQATFEGGSLLAAIFLCRPSQAEAAMWTSGTTEVPHVSTQHPNI